MKKDESHIDQEQLTAYIAGEGTEQERSVVENWINTSEENRQHYENHLKVYQLNYISDGDQENNTTTSYTFNVDQAWQKVSQQSEIHPTTGKLVEFPKKDDDSKRKFMFGWMKIAATILIGVSLVYFFIGRPDTTPITIAFKQGYSEYYLPDSSKVAFQGESEITYSPDFNISNRDLILSGAAYFDVKHNPDIPFIIKTQHGKIEVLGTAFSVEENDSNITVQVERGKVSLALIDDTLSPIMLERDEVGVLNLDTKTANKSKSDDLNNLYWANKRLTYRQRPLTVVLEELTQLFDKEIIYDHQVLEDCRITAVFKNQKFEDIINNLSVSLQFEYQISGDRVEINSNGCQTN
ncbi:MAG: FecR domain-containing protein [Bacteroidota bacterium]